MKQIKPCPFCGSEKVSLGSCLEKLQQVECINCGANGPCVDSANKAVLLWNFAPRKEDVKIKKSCANCRQLYKATDGKYRCEKSINETYNCRYWEASIMPYESCLKSCTTCKHIGFKVVDNNTVILNCCDHEIPHPENYVCHKWEETSAPLPLCNKPLNPENSRGLDPFLEADKGDMYVIRLMEPMVNQYQIAAEEAAELAQAMLKYCRMCGHGSWTPVNPKDATDAVIEEYADLLLAMEASFPRREGNKMFYNNLERVYKEKAKRWAERLKDHDN